MDPPPGPRAAAAPGPVATAASLDALPVPTAVKSVAAKALALLPDDAQRRVESVYTDSRAAVQSVISALHARGVPVDEDVLEELERNVKQYTAMLARQRGFARAFYAVPSTLLDWDAVQQEPTTRWSDLFQDLTFVASSFRLGKLLEDVLLNSADNLQILFGVYVFGTLFLVMRSVWGSKLDFHARFAYTDVVHKMFEVLEACVTAVLASQLPTSMAEADAPGRFLLFNFVLIRVGLYGYNLLRWVEILLFASGKNARGARATAAYFMAQSLTSVAPVAVSAALVAMGQPLWLPILFLLFSEYFVFVDLFRALVPCLNSRDRSVPIHVDYIVHREGEFTIIVLGEGVLALIILTATATVDAALTIGTLVPAYLILAGIQILHYSSQPFYAAGHALYKSRFRGQVWLRLQPIESALVLCVGVGLKITVALGNAAGDPRVWNVQWFLAVSLSLLMLLLQGIQLLHNGIFEELDLPWCSRVLKLALYGIKAFNAILFPLIPLGRMGSLGVLLASLALVSLGVLLQRLWDAIDAFVAHSSALAEEADAEALAMEKEIALQADAELAASAAAAAAAAPVPAFAPGSGRGVSPEEADEDLEASAPSLTSSGWGTRLPNTLAGVGPHAAPPLRLLPKRLRNTHVEAELRDLTRRFGGGAVQREIRAAATAVRASVRSPSSPP